MIQYNPLTNVVRKIICIKCILRHDIKYTIHQNRHDRTNVCESARIYYWKEIYREGSGGVKKRSHFFSLHFYVSHAKEFLDKAEKYYASWLSAYHHRKTG